MAAMTLSTPTSAMPGVSDKPGAILVTASPPQYQVGGQEAQIHDDDNPDDQQRTERPELTPGLYHLRHTERGPLRGVQRHEHRTDQVAENQTLKRSPDVPCR